jgi:hypothetical protein
VLAARNGSSWQAWAGRSARLVGLGIILFAVGFYFKHTALAGPLAAGLFLLLRAPRVAIAFGAGYALAVLLPFALLNALTDGGFAQHLVAFHRSWAWGNYVELATPFLLRYWPLFVVPLLTLAVDAARRRPDLPGLYLLSAVAVSLGGGTHGGNHNHFLETLLALAIANGSAVGRLLVFGRRVLESDRGQKSLLGSVVPAAAVALMLLPAAALLAEPAGGRAWLAGDLRPPSAAERLGWQQVLPVVAADAGPVYSDNVGLLLLAGQPIRYTDPFTLAAAVAAGQWSDAALVAAVRRREFSLIALRYDVGRLRSVPTDITPDLLAAIREHYTVADRNVMFLYRPRAPRP